MGDQSMIESLSDVFRYDQEPDAMQSASRFQAVRTQIRRVAITMLNSCAEYSSTGLSILKLWYYTTSRVVGGSRESKKAGRLLVSVRGLTYTFDEPLIPGI